jgi:hypothetical protein
MAVAKGVGSQTSLKLDSSGNARISYYDSINKDLKYASQSGSTWNILTVDSVGDVGADSSLALDSYEHPHISYCDNTNHALKYAVWNGSKWNILTIDYAGYAVQYTNPRPIGLTSLALDGNNLARISYFDESNYRLKYFVANTSFAAAGPSPTTVENSTSTSSSENSTSSSQPQSTASPSSTPEPAPQPDSTNKLDSQTSSSPVLTAIIATTIMSSSLAATATALFMKRKRK